MDDDLEISQNLVKDVFPATLVGQRLRWPVLARDHNTHDHGSSCPSSQGMSAIRPRTWSLVTSLALLEFPTLGIGHGLASDK